MSTQLLFIGIRLLEHCGTVCTHAPITHSDHKFTVYQNIKFVPVTAPVIMAKIRRQTLGFSTEHQHFVLYLRTFCVYLMEDYVYRRHACPDPILTTPVIIRQSNNGKKSNRYSFNRDMRLAICKRKVVIGVVLHSKCSFYGKIFVVVI